VHGYVYVRYRSMHVHLAARSASKNFLQRPARYPEFSGTGQAVKLRACKISSDTLTRMTGCLAGRARAFGPTIISCFTASASSAPGPRPGRDMLTTWPRGEGSSQYVHTAIKSRSLNGHGADLADTPGTWTCTALFGGPYPRVSMPLPRCGLAHVRKL
jgi:hypothetical protein